MWSLRYEKWLLALKNFRLHELILVIGLTSANILSSNEQKKDYLNLFPIEQENASFKTRIA